MLVRLSAVGRLLWPESEHAASGMTEGLVQGMSKLWSVRFPRADTRRRGSGSVLLGEHRDQPDLSLSRVRTLSCQCRPSIGSGGPVAGPLGEDGQITDGLHVVWKRPPMIGKRPDSRKKAAEFNQRLRLLDPRRRMIGRQFQHLGQFLQCGFGISCPPQQDGTIVVCPCRGRAGHRRTSGRLQGCCWLACLEQGHSQERQDVRIGRTVLQCLTQVANGPAGLTCPESNLGFTQQWYVLLAHAAYGRACRGCSMSGTASSPDAMRVRYA